MEPEDGGQRQHFFNNDYHSCNETERSMELRTMRSLRTISSEASFSRVQMIFRKRRRGGGEEGNSYGENSHQNSPSCHTRGKCNHPLSSPLVLLTTCLLLFLCLFPLRLVHSLPFDSRSASLGVGGDRGSYRSQMDLLIDPIHQAEFGDDGPLESKRVVAKSVFDMVLRTPAPPTSSSNRCPPGTQSPFEGGPCIKKSTDPVALVDQSFLLDTLRGLAKEGVLLSTGPTKPRKRRPSRPGGSSRTTPGPTTTTQATTTPVTTMPTSGDSTPIMEETTQETIALANSNMQPVFDEETTKLLEAVPSTLPSTSTPVEDGETRGTTNAELDAIAEKRRTTPSAATIQPSRPLPSLESNDNDEQIARITTLPSELPTSLPETTIAAPAEPLSSEQEKSDQNQQHNYDHDHVEGEPLIISTTQSASQAIDGVDISANVESQISPETTVEDPSTSSTRQTFPQNELLTTSEDGAEMTMANIDKDDGKIQSTTPTSTRTTLSSSLVHLDIDVTPDGAGEEMTGVNIPSPDTPSLEQADEGEKRGDMPATSSVEQQPDKFLTTRMIQEDAGEKYNILILNDNPKEEMPLMTTLPSSEVGEEKIIREPTPLPLNDDEDIADHEDRRTEQSPTQEPVVIIKSIPEVKSKRDEEQSPVTKEEQDEPLGGQGVDLIKRNEQVEGLQEDALKGIMMMMGEGDIRMTGAEDRKGVIGEVQAGLEGDHQPSSVFPIVNHRTDSTHERLASAEEMGTVMMTTTASTPPEKDIRNGDGADDDLQIINNPQISPSHNHYEVTKDGVEIGRTTPSTKNEKDEEDVGKGSSSREDFTNLARDQNETPEVIPATTLSPPEVVIQSSTPFSDSFRPTDRDSTLLQFQLPIVTNGPNHVENSREGGGGVGGFERFPEFPMPSAKIRFPSTSGNLEVPVEGGGDITRNRGTQKPIFVKDFQLEYPPLKNQEPLHLHREQLWESPKPFLVPPQAPSTIPARVEQSADRIQPVEYYESGSTEYLESELDRRHQKTRSRNRIRTPEQQHPSSTTQPLPVELSFYPGNSHIYRNHHLPSSSPSQDQRQSPPSPSSSQQPFFFDRRSPSTEYPPFGYPNFKPGHDRFRTNSRQLIW